MKNKYILVMLSLGFLVEGIISSYFFQALEYFNYYLYGAIAYSLLFTVGFTFFCTSNSKMVLLLSLFALITAGLDLFTTNHNNFTLISQLRAGSGIELPLIGGVNWSEMYRAAETIAIISVFISGIYNLVHGYSFFGSDNNTGGSGRYDIKAAQ